MNVTVYGLNKSYPYQPRGMGSVKKEVGPVLEKARQAGGEKDKRWEKGLEV